MTVSPAKTAKTVKLCVISPEEKRKAAVGRICRKGRF